MIGVGVTHVPLSTTFDVLSLGRLDVTPDVIELVVSSQHLGVVQPTSSYGPSSGTGSPDHSLMDY